MGKNNAITGFRGVVIFLIIYHHYSDRYSELFDGPMSISFPIVSHYGGMIGNIIFLVMTGFFMAKSLMLSEGGYITMGKYALNRYWRFWPTYAFAVLFIILFLQILPLPGRMCDFKTAVVDFFLIYHPGFSNIDGSHWFLSKLLIIQLFLSLILLVKEKSHRTKLLISITFLTVFLLVCEVYFGLTEGYVYSFLYMFSVLTGVLMAIFLEKKIYWLILALSSFIILVFFESPRVSVPTILFLVIFALIIKFPNFFSFLGSKPFMIVGSVSFSWYLVHQNIGFSIMYHYLPKGDISNYWIIVPLISTFIIAFIIEKITHNLPSKILK